MSLDFTNIIKYLEKLVADIYPQPQDAGHTSLAEESIKWVMDKDVEITSVLDAGCGEGFCETYFNQLGVEYTGVAFGNDVTNAQGEGHNVHEMDFSFLEYPDGSFDLIFSRHSLEHSPFPLLTLMEWNRVSKRYLALVLPDPSYWTYTGRNHYFVLNQLQWENLFKNSGWKIVREEVKSMIMTDGDTKKVNIEFWYLLEKVE